MEFNDYQELAADTAIYRHRKELGGMMYCGLGLAGEAGEVAGKIKKIYRDFPNLDSVPQDKLTEIADEIGDVLWYAAELAQNLNWSLGEIAARNHLKLQSRKARGVIGGSGDNR